MPAKKYLLMNKSNRLLKKTKHIVFSLFLLASSPAFAQNSCREDLAKAIENYNNGLYEQVIELLENRLNTCKYKGSERLQALKYLAAAHYEIDNIEQADKATYSFLKKEPLYEAQTIDPILFVEALQKYEQYPSFSIVFSMGTTQLNPVLKEIYTVWDNADYSKDYIINNYSTFSNSFSKSIAKGLNINLGVSITNFSYSREINFTDTTYINFKESSFVFKIPLELSYTRNIYKKFSASIYAGIYYVRYQNPKASLAGSVFSHDMLNQITQTEFNMSTYRNIDNVGSSWGLGLNYQINRFTINLKMNKFVNALDYTKKEKGFINPAEMNVYYADDLFNIKETSFSLGVSYTFSYKVKLRY